MIATILIFIAVLVALILVHEFGHFITAKKLGFRVDEFGLGFPPKVFSRTYGETEYSVNALPFGGFVRIFGEDPTEEAARTGPDSHRAFINKPRWKQALVLVAGVVFNVLFAWVLFAGAFMHGLEVPSDYSTFGQVQNERTIVTSILDGSVAADAGLQRGDKLVTLTSGSDTLTETTPGAVQQFIEQHSQNEVVLTYVRAGEEKTAAVIPAPVPSADISRDVVGIEMQGVGTLQLPPHTAVLESARFTFDALVAIIVAFGGLIANTVTGTADLSNVAGPVGIASLVSDVTQEGFIPLISFTAFISLNLAIINLVPFPALDGGRLVILGFEALKRNQIRPEIINTANLIGFALLIGLMLLVTYHDILRLLS